MAKQRWLPWWLGVALAGCGSAPVGPQEPVAPPPAADAGASGVAEPGDAPPGPVAEVPQDVGALPGPPGADPPGFEVYAPLPEGLALSRALWKIEGPLPPDELHEGIDHALAEIATCLADALPGGRLPMHLIIEASGRVVEVGAPLADAGLREAITCAQGALRMIRFPAAAGDTTVRLIVER